MCYCNQSDAAILDDLRRGIVSDAAMLCARCWSRICSVRGRNSWAVDAEAWRDICRERGYLFQRQNPRGF